MRVTSARELGSREFRRAFERLDRLPMRPTTARKGLASLLDDDEASPAALPATADWPTAADFDPAWALARSRAGGKRPPALAIIETHAWWPSVEPGSPTFEAFDRLWRHSAAVALAARRLARDAGELDPDAIARAGLLHGLGLWALAAVDPSRLVAWFAEPEPERRRELEVAWLGTDLANLGRDLATRWGCERRVVDAAWLHGDTSGDLADCAHQPDQLAYIQQALALAERTPWAHRPTQALLDPRARLLTAEVQSRCPGSLIAPDATAREERLTRDNARLRRICSELETERAATSRFTAMVAESTPSETLESWSDRASLAWCAEPGVAAARVVWGSDESDASSSRPASLILPLGDLNQPAARVHLWFAREGSDQEPGEFPLLPAWNAWVEHLAERDRLGALLDRVATAHRGRTAREESARRQALLAALAEFAAGAGHELNNPLAVIVGRAQLLLAREADPDAMRSLRAILTQAQRASRILRDLMYVARPPEPRPRPCSPDEVVKTTLRDFQTEAEARGIRLVVETRENAGKAWVDPDPLRHLAEILTRNALEATPSGGTIRFVAGGDARTLRWTVHDTGRGVSAQEGAHLFDPFYCGRQAGRGLGLGLPRAARIVGQAGGDIRWQSTPGHGTTFVVAYPVGEDPAPAAG